MISELVDSELDAVLALWAATGLTRPWNDPQADAVRAVEGATSSILVAHDGDDVVGSVMVGLDGHRGWVYYLAVAPERQGEGWGRRLMAAAEDWLRDRGAPKLQLIVRTGNSAVLGFYDSLGYGDQRVTVLGRFLDPALEQLRASETDDGLRSAAFAELTAAQLYAILQLRSRIFVVEQECVFLDLDGRDQEPNTIHFWWEESGETIAAARVLEIQGGHKISRVVTAPEHRGRGLADMLIDAALIRWPTGDFVLDAQAHLVDLYARHGFAAEGDRFDEDGISHQTMRLTR